MNAYWQSIGHRDSIWRAYIVTRWNIERPERLKRSCGTDDFYELYRYLDRNRYLPRGKYTTKVRPALALFMSYALADD